MIHELRHSSDKNGLEDYALDDVSFASAAIPSAFTPLIFTFAANAFWFLSLAVVIISRAFQKGFPLKLALMVAVVGIIVGMVAWRSSRGQSSLLTSGSSFAIAASLLVICLEFVLSR
jgi:hypothetical protein